MLSISHIEALQAPLNAFSPSFLKKRLKNDPVMAHHFGFVVHPHYHPHCQMIQKILHHYDLESWRQKGYWIDPELQAFSQGVQLWLQKDCENFLQAQQLALENQWPLRILILEPLAYQKILQEKRVISTLSDSFYSVHMEHYQHLSPLFWIDHGYIQSFKASLAYHQPTVLMLERSLQLGHLDISNYLKKDLTPENSPEFMNLASQSPNHQIYSFFKEEILELCDKKMLSTEALLKHKGLFLGLSQEEQYLYAPNDCLDRDFNKDYEMTVFKH